MLCNEYVKADNKLVFNLSSLTFIFLAFSLRRDLFFPIYDCYIYSKETSNGKFGELFNA